jgi:hypothetical protein
MTTATLRLTTPLPEAAGKAKPAPVKRRSWLVRFHEAIIEARMRQAMRELALHRHLLESDPIEPADSTPTHGRAPL